MRIVFMGTPDIAAVCLDRILKDGFEVAGVYTQPDRPRGRGMKLTASPVKVLAMTAGIPVFQPDSFREEETVEQLRALKPDICAVVAYGRLLPQKVLDIPKYGCINIHASLLPMYRGAAPIQQVILDGQKETGVTTMYMEEGLDTGDMLLKTVVPIAADETGGSLFDRLAQVGGELIVRTMEGLAAGTITPEPQVESEATHVGMIKKSFGQLDFSLEAVVLERRIRGLNPWPSAYTKLGNKNLKVWWARVESALPDTASGHITEPGVICHADPSGIWVSTGKDYLVLEEIQLEGKKRMSAADFLRGKSLEIGTKLGR